ncbi:MAG: hypothetical protein ACRCYV_04085 [Aeromonas sp.]
MMLNYSDPLRTARASALAAAIDGGAVGATPGAASLTFYTAPRPATGAAISSQTALVALAFTHPCAQSISSGVLTLAPLAEAMASAGGTPTWARIRDRSGAFVADLDVGTTAAADLQLPVADLYQGALVRIDSATISEA